MVKRFIKRTARAEQDVRDSLESSRFAAENARRGNDKDGKEDILCNISEACGSCEYINGDYNKGLQAKHNHGLAALKDVIAKAHVAAPVGSERKAGYRTLAKLAVRAPVNAPAETAEGAPNRFAIGLFAPGSHDVVAIGRCPVQRHTINSFVEELTYELNYSKLAPYDEVAHTGDLRYLVVRASHLTEELLVTYVIRDPSATATLKAMTQILKKRGHRIRSAFVDINDEKTNAIFQHQTKRIVGLERFRMRVCELDFEMGPTSFFQINPWQAETIYRRIEALCSRYEGQVAWDLYCGLGQISLVLARAGMKVFGMEENPAAIEDARRNGDANLKNHGEKPTFVAGRVEDGLSLIPDWAQKPDVIVVNPSRRGLQPTVCALIKGKLEQYPDCRLIYVSCEVTTLARDLALITDGGRFVRQVESFDMFPHTTNMEWLAIV